MGYWVLMMEVVMVVEVVEVVKVVEEDSLGKWASLETLESIKNPREEKGIFSGPLMVSELAPSSGPDQRGTQPTETGLLMALC